MNISVELVKQLRDITMASLKDCKESLVEAEGDLNKAQEILKKKGIASAGKKWDRETKEGKIGYLIKDKKIAVVKLGCETDFVAKNDLFTNLVQSVLDIAINHEVSSFDELDDSVKTQINETIAEIIAKLGENMKVLQLFVKTIPSEDVFVYTHAGSKLISVIYYNSIAWDVSEEIKKVALQVAAMDPKHLTIDHIPAEHISLMTKEFEEEVKASGKPEAVMPSIVAGKLNKKYSEIVLHEQGYMGDETQKIKNIIEGKATLIGFERIGFAN